MRNLLRPLILTLVAAVLAAAALAAASGDGPVSLSYLTQVFFPQAQEQGEKAVDDALGLTYDAAADKLERLQQELLGAGGQQGGGLYSATLQPRNWYDGQTIGLSTGGGVLMLKGAATVAHNGVVVDVTDGVEVPNGGALAENHRYLVGEDTLAAVMILSGYATLGVQGEYALSGGKEDPMPFLDVKQTDWYYDSVCYVYENKLFSGMGDGLFGPGQPMTRAMLMTVLYQMAGAPQAELEAAGVSLTDVPDSAWYAPYVKWGVAQGVASGTGDGGFTPDGQVTREQVVVMLYSFASRYLGREMGEGADLSGYADHGQVSSWAAGAMAWAVAQGVVSGSTDGVSMTLNPGHSANRAEVAAMLRAFAEKI